MALGKGLVLSYWVRWLWIEVLRMKWGSSTLFNLIWCCLNFYSIVIGMVHLWWRCYVLFLILIWPCRRYIYAIWSWPSWQLLEVIWLFVVFYYVKHYNIYLHVESYMYSSIHVILGDYVRLCLWHYVYSVGLVSLLFLHGYMRLCWFHW